MRLLSLGEFLIQNVWQHCLRELSDEIPSDEFETYIKPLQVVFEEETIQLYAPNIYVEREVSKAYLSRITDLISRAQGADETLNIMVGVGHRPALEPVRAGSQPEMLKNGDVANKANNLNKDFLLETYVEGKSNELAKAAASQVASHSGVAYNPLLLYGGVGLGKTHLMHAIAWEIKKRDPNAKVLYLSAEQFMYRFVQALRFKDTISFKEMFRSVDVLMVDDVQFIAGKSSTQEEFFHTFNALIDQNKQVIISGDRAPVDMEQLEDRIKSRLQWGLVVDVHPTDYELRLGILQSKQESQARYNSTVEVSPGVLEFMAQRISSNVRVLEGALTRLYAFGSLVGRPVTLEMAQESLSDILRATDRKVTIDEIIRKVTDHYGVNLTDMLSARRTRSIARPRQVAMYLSKKLTSKSLPEIGRRFGKRDHTTVIHAVKKIEELQSIDNQIAKDIEVLRRMLEG